MGDKKTTKSLMPNELIASRILFIRNQKVMLDRDLAALYGVETKQLKRQVRRNIERFPPSFMFELNKEENEILRSQFGTLKQGAHNKYLPFAFTKHGILMISSVLNSELAIKMSV
ncbi:MAG: ORF6N domain-containing protein [Flavobacteriaceae bacterium]